MKEGSGCRRRWEETVGLAWDNDAQRERSSNLSVTVGAGSLRCKDPTLREGWRKRGDPDLRLGTLLGLLV